MPNTQIPLARKAFAAAAAPRLTRARTLGLIAAAPALAYARPARAREAHLRMAVVPTDSYALPYYAFEQGYFAKAGLGVEIHPFTTGGQITGAVAGNALDVGLADPIQVGDAVNRGISFKYFAGGTTYSTDAPTTQLCVLQNGPIKSVADLAERRSGSSASIRCRSLQPESGSRTTAST
jgi:ABC-type nitrate/sulfonate/bicarbonate transport system substrate-binding protein